MKMKKAAGKPTAAAALAAEAVVVALQVWTPMSAGA
jgi:hypothetical protein